MIVTLTPNPALDITYAVPTVTLGESHRVGSVTERAGGKGLNVAAVLATMLASTSNRTSTPTTTTPTETGTSPGAGVVAVAPVGALDRDLFAADLDARRVPHRLIESPCPTRRSVAVVESDGRATLLNEAGVGQSRRVWQLVTDEVERLAGSARVLTVSGSLPPGTDPDLVLRLTELAHAHDLLVVLDVSGEALARALPAHPDLVKPNRSEAAGVLHALAGTTDPAPAATATLPTAEEAAYALVGAGARAAVVSDGAAGLVLVHGELALRARLPRPLTGNPTGAGDALTAALAAGLDQAGQLPDGAAPWEALLRAGVAWSAAAVLQPVAGALDPADADRLAPDVEIEEIRS
ncbi:PfkB family carbohydrate kinase [Terrabacter sp. NPDC000476]|uniref:1-phosphofructokinase family hexose kinase n=1 Tax=Terrabacter sp. NPDC000476 TaxID=3154258 RepID=UPI00332D3C64